MIPDNMVLTFALEAESDGLFSDHDVLYTGVGKVNAVQSLTKYIHENSPDLVVNLGTAGSSALPRKSVVHCTQFIQRDMDVSPLGFEKWQTPFSDTPILLEHGKSIEALPHAVCGTGDSFDVSHQGDEYQVVDMEAYALAKVCHDHNIPFMCLKYISDGADDNASEDWEPVLSNAAKALHQSFVEHVLPIKLSK